MRDIVYEFNDEGLFRELNIKPLVIGKDIHIINSLKQPRNIKGSIILDMQDIGTDNNITQQKFISFLKTTKPFGIVNAEMNSKKDFVHHRGSGLNHIIFSAMREYGINYILNISILNNPIIMGRAMQNIYLARKSNTRVIVASFADTPKKLFSKKDVEGLLRLLSMDTKDIKNAFL
jgi:hypothetical protein